MLTLDEFIKRYFQQCDTDKFNIRVTLSIIDKNGITNIFEKWNNKGYLVYPRKTINYMYELYKSKQTPPTDLLI